MRRICAALCFSLFASLIHAGSIPMPSDAMSQAHAGHVVKHDCHTQADTKVEKSQSTNHQTHHQCCLGVVANLSTNTYIQPDFSNHFSAVVPQLIVEALLNKI